MVLIFSENEMIFMVVQEPFLFHLLKVPVIAHCVPLNDNQPAVDGRMEHQIQNYYFSVPLQKSKKEV